MTKTKFSTYITEPKEVQDVKVNLERAINDLREYYQRRFYDLIYKRGCNNESQRAYENMHLIEAIHNIKLGIKED